MSPGAQTAAERYLYRFLSPVKKVKGLQRNQPAVYC